MVASTQTKTLTNDHSNPLRLVGEKLAAEPEYKYARFLPSVAPPSGVLPPLEEFTHVDPAHRAKKLANPRAIFEAPGVQVSHIIPATGSEVRGVKLHELDASGRDQVALEVAKRGVVAFRDQEFGEQSFDWLKEWGSHFGRLHVHQTSTHPEGAPEFHLVYRSESVSFNYERAETLNSLGWHSDVTYEKQPLGLTTLFLLDSPESGGDTIFADMREAYNRLSKPMQEFLEGLDALHSGVEQANHSRAGHYSSHVRREPVEHVHPVIRRHPVTGEKALYVNSGFTKKIIGLRKEESDTILQFLFNHIARGADFQARVRWSDGTPGSTTRTVVLWDNRVLSHTAVVDFVNIEGNSRRHGARISPQAEVPIAARDIKAE